MSDDLTFTGLGPMDFSTSFGDGTGATLDLSTSFADLDATVPFFNASFDSEPPSGSLTNLTSPSPDIHASPDFFSTSPHFSSDDVSPAWPPLFAPAPAAAAPAAPQITTADPAALMQRNPSSSSHNTSSANASPAHAIGVAPSRRSAVPAVARHKHSPSGGVTKARTRKAPLKDIKWDETDARDKKRAKNTLAARESRARKSEHLAALEARNEYLEDRNKELRETLVAFGYAGPLVQEE